MAKTKKDIKQGHFLSYWESGAMFRAPCSINPTTKEIFNIMNVGHPADDDNLTTETVEILDVEYPVHNLDEILELYEPDEIKDQLSEIVHEKSYWYSYAGKNLYTELKACSSQ